MAKEYQLSYDASEIDNRLQMAGNAVLFTEQNLTEEQKAQARANLGINISSDDSNNNAITTEYVYTYDGDNASDKYLWIVTGSGYKALAKIGEIPEGTLNLVGSTIFRTNPSNHWLDKTFTVTEEHLTKVLNKTGTDVPAIQDGLIQIFDTKPTDSSEFAVLCICTKRGRYRVAFDDWNEVMSFTETGIYAYDKTALNGNDYLESFTFSATVESDDNESSDSTSTTNPIKYLGKEITMFSKGICIGDSITEGYFDSDTSSEIIKKYSYPYILKRMTGIDIINAGISGTTAQTWREASLNSDSYNGKWVNEEWTWDVNSNDGNTRLDYSDVDFAIIHLGINDMSQLESYGNIQNLLSDFEININNIISDLKSARQGIKIFLATIIPYRSMMADYNFGQMNDKIIEIANATDDVYLIDLNAYSECLMDTVYGNKWHLTALGYNKMASEIASIISYTISQNLDDFKSVQFIGTSNMS